MRMTFFSIIRFQISLRESYVLDTQLKTRGQWPPSTVTSSLGRSWFNQYKISTICLGLKTTDFHYWHSEEKTSLYIYSLFFPALPCIYPWTQPRRVSSLLENPHSNGPVSPAYGETFQTFKEHKHGDMQTRKGQGEIPLGCQNLMTIVYGAYTIGASNCVCAWVCLFSSCQWPSTVSVSPLDNCLSQHLYAERKAIWCAATVSTNGPEGGRLRRVYHHLPLLWAPNPAL